MIANQVCAGNNSLLINYKIRLHLYESNIRKTRVEIRKRFCFLDSLGLKEESHQEESWVRIT